jgi:hypothetical protein
MYPDDHRAMKLPGAPFYPLTDLARAWGCSEEMLRIFAEHGACDGRKLRISELPLDGAILHGVTHEDREAFEEGGRRERRPDTINGNERASLLACIGVLAVAFLEKGALAMPYRAAGVVERFAGGMGLGPVLSDDTMAKLIRAGLDELERRGAYRVPRKAESLALSNQQAPEKPSVGVSANGSDAIPAGTRTVSA